MADAASEMHLLREAESQLGAAIWEKVEAIEELSVEYWNLRKFSKELAAVRKKLSSARKDLTAPTKNAPWSSISRKPTKTFLTSASSC